MNQWDSDAIVLSARPHGENGLILSVMTEQFGRTVAYIPGGQSKSRRVGISPGAFIHAHWQSRLLDQMGTFTVEPLRHPAGAYMDDGLKLAALISACTLCDVSLPEREAHPALYHGLAALMDQLNDDLWGVCYVAWEIAFMKELGYALDFKRCAGGGDAGTLEYISPKSGVAVSAAMGAIYKSKLIPLPQFLRPDPDLEALGSLDDIAAGLNLTGYFLEHWVFNHHRSGVPEPRIILAERIIRAVEGEQKVIEVASFG